MGPLPEPDGAVDGAEEFAVEVFHLPHPALRLLLRNLLSLNEINPSEHCLSQMTYYSWLKALFFVYQNPTVNVWNAGWWKWPSIFLSIFQNDISDINEILHMNQLTMVK